MAISLVQPIVLNPPKGVECPKNTTNMSSVFRGLYQNVTGSSPVEKNEFPPRQPGLVGSCVVRERGRENWIFEVLAMVL